MNLQVRGRKGLSFMFLVAFDELAEAVKSIGAELELESLNGLDVVELGLASIE